MTGAVGRRRTGTTRTTSRRMATASVMAARASSRRPRPLRWLDWLFSEVAGVTDTRPPGIATPNASAGHEDRLRTLLADSGQMSNGALLLSRSEGTGAHLSGSAQVAPSGFSATWGGCKGYPTRWHLVSGRTVITRPAFRCTLIALSPCASTRYGPGLTVNRKWNGLETIFHLTVCPPLCSVTVLVRPAGVVLVTPPVHRSTTPTITPDDDAGLHETQVSARNGVMAARRIWRPICAARRPLRPFMAGSASRRWCHPVLARTIGCRSLRPTSSPALSAGRQARRPVGLWPSGSEEGALTICPSGTSAAVPDPGMAMAIPSGEHIASVPSESGTAQAVFSDPAVADDG